MTAADPALRPTLWRQLWNLTFGAVLVVWLTLSVVAISTGFRESRKLLDAQLASVGQLWLAAAVDRPSRAAPAPMPPVQQGEYFQNLAVLAWEDGTLVNDSHRLAAGLDLSALTQPGLHTVVYTDASGTHGWRAFVAAQPRDGRVYRVAVLLDQRAQKSLAWDMAEHVTLPALLLLPLVALLLGWTIRRGLRPLGRLSREVAGLDSAAGQRLDDAHRHREFVSTVSAINTRWPPSRCRPAWRNTHPRPNGWRSWSKKPCAPGASCRSCWIWRARSATVAPARQGSPWRRWI